MSDATEWKVNPHTDSIQYLGGWMTSRTYRGCIVRENSGPQVGKWAVCPRDWRTEDDHTVTYAPTVELARKALENVTPGGHKCEVFVNKWVGHCPDRASVVTFSWEGEKAVRGILLCPTHTKATFTDMARVSVEEWETGNGPITHESGPILGDRIAPPMAPVRRGENLSRPRIWGDDWQGYQVGMTLAQDVSADDLVVFDHGNAFEVLSIDIVPMPHSDDMIRFNCNGGATFCTYRDRAVPCLYPPF
ncbi:hypothetical protein ACWDWS_02495 [Streptomyces sp. NPDC003328]